MVIKTAETNTIQPFLKKIFIPQKDSHKGQNGKILIIGGSSLFHSASLWAAEVASHFVDIVHYSSTLENEKIFLSLKKKFSNGIVVKQTDLLDYVKEDDAILAGPGMMREGAEGEYTHDLIKSLIEKFPKKRFVFDGGALQMMEPDWLLKLKQPPILTPHEGEFEKLFGKQSASEAAKKYNCVILRKSVDDTVSDGQKTIIIKGGNQGLTKGGTGDLLAGLTASLCAKNETLISAITASYLLKKTADKLFLSHGYWYNIDDLIDEIPGVLKNLLNI